MQNEYKVQEGQTLLDIAIHNFGSIEAAFEIAAHSKLSLTEELPAGSVIVLPKVTRSEQVNKYVVASIANRNITPCTGPKMLSGIDYVQVGISLKVS